MIEQLTQIRTSIRSPIITKVRDAFSRSLCGEGRLPEEILSMDGMSGRKYRLFINNLVRETEDAHYLEVGVWAGSTLCSAINGNIVRAIAIDNWSEFGGPKNMFIENLEKFRTPQANVEFIEKDFRRVDFSSLGKFNIYLFDGPPTGSSRSTRRVCFSAPGSPPSRWPRPVADRSSTSARSWGLSAAPAVTRPITHQRARCASIPRLPQCATGRRGCGSTRCIRAICRRC